MKQIIAFTFLLFVHTAVTAQLSMQVHMPATGLVQRNQLWNVMVTNSTASAYECKLNMVLSDRNTGDEVMTAATSQFTVARGARQLNVNLLEPVQYNYLTMTGDSRLQGLLPPGNYMACYTLTLVNTKADAVTECVQFDAEPLTPPMLTFPADSSVTEALPSQFTWLPPTPAAMFSRLQYDIVIVPVNDGQLAEDAIQNNIPFYSTGNITGNNLNYPGASPAFEKNKWYAWQVIAKDDKSYAAKSETWVFQVNAFSKKADVVTESYADAKSYYTGKTYYFSDHILVSFTNPYTAKKMRYAIRHAASKKTIAGIPDIEMKQGLNNLSVPVKKLKGLKKNELYTMEIYNSSNTTYYVNFIVR